MTNLPPGVSISDSDAPWNQSHPEPDYVCPECERYATHREMAQKGDGCPECGSEMEGY